jgi:hypothetical protein
MSDFDSEKSLGFLTKLDPSPDGRTRVGRPVVTRNLFVGMLRTLGDNTATMSLHSQARLAIALTLCLDEQTKAVEAKDRLDTAIEKYHARRTGILNPADQEELEEERHKRMLARLRREREVYDAKQETMESLHKLEATEEFKEQKFAAGRARYGAKIAERQVGEAVARSSMEPEPKEAPASEKPVSMEAVLADLRTNWSRTLTRLRPWESPPNKCARIWPLSPHCSSACDRRCRPFPSKNGHGHCARRSGAR